MDGMRKKQPFQMSWSQNSQDQLKKGQQIFFFEGTTFPQSSHTHSQTNASLQAACSRAIISLLVDLSEFYTDTRVLPSDQGSKPSFFHGWWNDPGR